MTHDEIARALAELRLAARTKGWPKADVTMTFNIDRYSKPCQVALWESGGPCHLFYDDTPLGAITKASNWIAGQILWTPEAVAKTLGIEPARDVRAAAE